MAGKKEKKKENRETKDNAKTTKDKVKAFARMIRKLRDLRFEISLLFLVIGVALTIIAFFSPAGDKTPAFLYGVVSAVGNWYLWFWVVGPLMVIGSSWYAYDYIKKRRMFENLMNTNSKAKFLENLPDLEDVVWYLKEKDRIRLAQKKKKLLR